MADRTARSFIEVAEAAMKIGTIVPVLPSRKSHVRELLRIDGDQISPQPPATKNYRTRKIGQPIRQPPRACRPVNLSLYCTTKEAAELAGITEAYVRQLLAKGTLKGEKIGGTWLVLKSSVATFARIPRMGRPPKPRT